jgi:membrane-bound lytic murein transglycosylase D
MIKLLIRRSGICALLLPTLFISACADKQHSADLRLSDNQELVANPIPVDVEDPETDLTAELEALRRAGSWTSPSVSPPNQEVPSDLPASDFPLTINNQVQAYLDLFQTQQRKNFTAWLTRAGKYLPLMQRELKEAGLPEDLAYLAMIESGYNQKAYSKAHASGLWQFIPGTGALYGLKMDRYLDERRDAEKSTKAAVKFLGNLYDEFGDWHLAVAAYNAGPGKINKGLERYDTKDFWSLAEYDYLAMETKRYVPKLIASIIIAKNPDKYGFTDIQPENSLAYDTLEVGPGLPLDAISLISNCDRQTIELLNQELSTNQTPLDQSSYRIKLPIGSKKLASSNLPRLQRITTTDYKSHTITKGESLSQVCNQYDVNKTTLLKVNNLHSPKLATGQRLRIPFQTTRYHLLPEGSARTIAAATQGNQMLHRIKKGESIVQIAQKYKVPAELITSWNNLPPKYKPQAGQQLSIYLDLKDKTLAPAKTTPILAAKSPEKDSLIISATQTKKIATEKTSNVKADTIPTLNSPNKENTIILASKTKKLQTEKSTSTKTIAKITQSSKKQTNF